jgi:hypothetical protein
MVLLIIFAIILLFIAWVLFVPFRFYIDTTINRYYFEWSGLIKVNFIPDEIEIFFIKVKVPFYHFVIYPIRKLINEEIEKKEKKKSKKDEESKKKKSLLRRINKKEVRRIKLFSKLGWKVFKALRMKKLDVNIDTGDVIYNAWLIPVFVALNGNRSNLRVNYQGIVSIVLLFEHSVFRILVILIKNLYHNRRKLKNL